MNPASHKARWNAAEQWLGRQLAAGPTPIVDITTRGREAGLDRAELAAALGAMPGVERCDGSWTLTPTWREYWRGWLDGVAVGDEAARDARKDIVAACSRARREDRARIQAILTSPLCDGRADLATHLCFCTDMPWREALATLGVAAQSAELLPPYETDDQRRERICHLGELVGKPVEAKDLAEKVGVTSAVAATLLVLDVDESF